MLRTVALAALLACLAAPAAASASTASVDLDGRITVVAADVQCGGGSPVVRLGDRDDSLLYSDDTTDFLIGPADVDGGAGADSITTAMSADEVDGGEGNDTIVGGAGVDDIKTGEHDDVIDLRDGAGGDKLLQCGPGTDTIQADTGDLVAADCENVTRPQSPAQDVGAPGTHRPPRAQDHRARHGREHHGQEAAPAPLAQRAVATYFHSKYSSMPTLPPSRP